MKVIIAGSREFNDFELLCKVCDKILSSQKNVEVVSGTARGADRLGERYAKERGYSIKQFPADWAALGRAAGYVRNSEMGDYGDALILFWNGTSMGSKNMNDVAIRKGLKIRIINF